MIFHSQYYKNNKKLQRKDITYLQLNSLMKNIITGNGLLYKTQFIYDILNNKYVYSIFVEVVQFVLQRITSSCVFCFNILVYIPHIHIMYMNIAIFIIDTIIFSQYLIENHYSLSKNTYTMINKGFVSIFHYSY